MLWVFSHEVLVNFTAIWVLVIAVFTIIVGYVLVKHSVNVPASVNVHALAITP